MRWTWLAALFGLIAPALISEGALAAPPPGAGWQPLFNGRDLQGWTFRNPKAKRVWVACSDAQLDPADPARLVPIGKGGTDDAVLLFGDDGRGSDILTDRKYGDYELAFEFMVPKGSNSGVYNRGLYEIQIFDSFGVEHPAVHDCGALYERAVPPRNLARAPGQWQSYHITMRGHKLTLVWNGEVVYQDRDVRQGETDKAAFERLNKENASKPPELRVKLEDKAGRYVGYFGEGGTRSSLEGPDRPGPILLQGDHGPVAFRRLYIRPLDSK